MRILQYGHIRTVELKSGGLGMNRLKWFVTAIVCVLVTAGAAQTGHRVRQPTRAGLFYPGAEAELRQMISSFLSRAEVSRPEGEIAGLWAPHAGYVFSGQIAANGYSLLRGADYDLVVVLGPSHYVGLRGASVGDFTAYRTPLGDVRVDTGIVRQLWKLPLFDCVPDAHVYEHCLEVQIPFIQTVLPEVPILPVLVGQLSYGETRKIADAVLKAVKGRKVLFIASSDMSHYPPYRAAYDVDGRMLKAVGRYDAKNVLWLSRNLLKEGIQGLESAMCGASALSTVMVACKKMNAGRVQVLPYANSGDIYGERNRVVGYGAAVFYREGKQTGGKAEEKTRGETRGKTRGEPKMSDEIEFSKAERETLFRIARSAIVNAVRQKQDAGGKIEPPLDVTESNLMEKRGVFVTLMNGRRLRGCIGYFDAVYPLHEIVSKMAQAAATEDPRFFYDPVTESELDQITIKISILSERKKIDSIEEIEVGKHGIWITQGNRGGTYLPEVAVEQGWDRQEFVEHCCMEKAGLPRDAWKTGAELYIYSSQILTEK